MAGIFLFEKLECKAKVLQIHNLRDMNINRLVGLYLDGAVPTIFEEYCKKGSIENLIAMQRTDMELKLSLIKDFTSVSRADHSNEHLNSPETLQCNLVSIQQLIISVIYRN